MKIYLKEETKTTQNIPPRSHETTHYEAKQKYVKIPGFKTRYLPKNVSHFMATVLISCIDF